MTRPCCARTAAGFWHSPHRFPTTTTACAQAVADPAPPSDHVRPSPHAAISDILPTCRTRPHVKQPMAGQGVLADGQARLFGWSLRRRVSTQYGSLCSYCVGRIFGQAEEPMGESYVNANPIASRAIAATADHGSVGRWFPGPNARQSRSGDLRRSGSLRCIVVVLDSQPRQALREFALHEVDQPFAYHAAQIPRQAR